MNGWRRRHEVEHQQAARAEMRGGEGGGGALVCNGNARSLIQCVDSQIWHMLRPTGLTGRVCTVRVELGFL